MTNTAAINGGAINATASGRVQRSMRGRHALLQRVAWRSVARHLLLSVGSATRLAAGHAILHAVPARLAGAHRLRDAAAARLQAAHVLRWTPAARLLGRHRSVQAARMRFGYPLRGVVSARLSTDLLHGDGASARIVGRHELRQRDRVTARWRGFHQLASSPSQQAAQAPQLVHQGRTLPIDAIEELYHDEGAAAWVGTVRLARLEDYARVSIGDDVRVDWMGESWQLVVDGRELRQEGPASRAGVLQLLSPVSRLGRRHRAPEPITLPPGTARQAVEYLLQQPVSWQLVDWPIPAAARSGHDTTPLELARRIVEAGGGSLESAPDGTMLVRHRYPSAVTDWAAATPDHVLTALDDLYATAETGEARPLFNRYRVTDGRDVTSNWAMEWVPDEGDPFAGELRLYPWPWDGTVQALTTRSGVTLAYQGAQSVEREEVIEFVGGQGRTSKPVSQLLAVSWLDVDLGQVTADGEALTAATAQQSLASVRYQVRYHAWRVTASAALDPPIAQLVTDDA